MCGIVGGCVSMGLGLLDELHVNREGGAAQAEQLDQIREGTALRRRESSTAGPRRAAAAAAAAAAATAAAAAGESVGGGAKHEALGRRRGVRASSRTRPPPDAPATATPQRQPARAIGGVPA